MGDQAQNARLSTQEPASWKTILRSLKPLTIGRPPVRSRRACRLVTSYDILVPTGRFPLKSMPKTLLLTAFVIAAAGISPAQVPPNIAKELVTIGRGVCVPETAFLYRPLQPNPPYAGVTFTRDISFGPIPRMFSMLPSP